MREGIRWGVVAALAVTLVVGGFVDSASAGRKKRLTAKINGKGFRIPPKFVGASTNGLGLYIIAGAKPTVHLGGTIKTLTITCVVSDLSGATFPFTVPCGAAYSQTKASRHPSTQAWDTEGGLQVTFESFDGTRLTGTFSGTIEQPDDQHPGAAGATVANGKLAVDLPAS